MLDVRMAKFEGVWMPGRVVDAREHETLICLYHNGQAYWIENRKITNENYHRAYTNVNGDEWIADGTQIAATSEKLLIEQHLHKLRQEWNEEDAKHVKSRTRDGVCV